MRGVDAVGWYVKDMIDGRASVAQDVVRRSQEAAAKFDAEMVIMGCAIIAAIYQQYLMQRGTPKPAPILNPHLLAPRLADLHSRAGHFLARQGYSMKPTGRFATQLHRARKIWNNTKPDFSK